MYLNCENLLCLCPGQIIGAGLGAKESSAQLRYDYLGRIVQERNHHLFAPFDVDRDFVCGSTVAKLEAGSGFS